MGYEYRELDLKKTIFKLPSGKSLFGPKQALGSLYKEFVIEGVVFQFYLHKATTDAFVYKYMKTRKKEAWDNKLPTLLHLID